MEGLNNIIGHEKVKEFLDKSLTNNKIANSYIFSGAKGLGKFRMAKIFAKNLQCDFSDNMPDCCIIDEGGKNIGIDVIREKIINDIVVFPMQKKYKIYIIKNAQKLTVQAQNALLKTLEEPPEYAVIILICNDERKLLDTIKSRSIILHFVSPSIEEASKCIMDKLEISEEDALMLCKITDCNIGQAKRYSEIYKNKKIWDEMIHVLIHIYEMKNYELVSFIKKLEDIEKEFFMQLLFCMYKDMLNYKISHDPNSIILKSIQMQIMNNIKSVSYDYMYASIDSIIKAIERIEANANIESVMEVLLMNIKELSCGNSNRG